MKRESQVRQTAAVSAVLLAALFILPLAVIVPFRSELFGRETPVDETEGAPFVSGDLDARTTLQVLNGDQVEEMDLGTYLVGVVRAEMPASFEQEALKAQAVAARTYTLYKIQTGGNHGDAADICTDSTCCQAYISEERARSNWGEDADAYEKKIEEAVTGTDGQAILYGGVPILAVFHSSSAGLTRAAGEVWINDLPYLQAVASPEAKDAPTTTAARSSRRRNSGRDFWPPTRRRTCPGPSPDGWGTPSPTRREAWTPCPWAA